MTYTGKVWKGGWTYNPNGDSFDDKVGRTLCSGVNLQESLRSKALGNLSPAASLTNSPKTTLQDIFNQQTVGSTDSQDQSFGRLSWVNPQGQYLGPVGSDSYSPGSTGGSVPKLRSGPGSAELASTLTLRQRKYAGMSPVERSMFTWSRVAPGASASAYLTPASTFMDHFGDFGPNHPTPDKRYFLKKTEFTDYTEVKLKSMQHI